MCKPKHYLHSKVRTLAIDFSFTIFINKLKYGNVDQKKKTIHINGKHF